MRFLGHVPELAEQNGHDPFVEQDIGIRIAREALVFGSESRGQVGYILKDQQAAQAEQSVHMPGFLGTERDGELGHSRTNQCWVSPSRLSSYSTTLTF